MCGGKGSQGGGGAGALGWGGLAPAQQQTTQASPQALGWYNQAMGLAQQAVSKPYQQFGTTPQDFVAQLNAQQQAAQQGIQQQAAATQPFSQMGAGMQAAAGMGNAAQMAGAYMNPYMQQVVSPVQQALQQQQGQQLAQQQAQAIQGGAFGGERAGLQRAVLQGQQQLGMGQALSPLYQTGYGQALGAAQTDLARQLAAGQGLSQTGLAAQQASLAAGTLGQQTQQAGINALYNQFQQQQMWPYMQGQYLAGIAGGLGPLTGQQTYQAQAMSPFGSFFSHGGEVNSRMGGAVHEAGDYARGGYATDGGVKGSVSADYGPDYGSDLEKLYAEESKLEDMPTGQIQGSQGLKTENLTGTKQESSADKIKALTESAKNIYGMGKDVYGLGKGAYDYLNSGSPSLSKWLSGAGADTAQTAPLDLAGATSGGGGFLAGLGSALGDIGTTALEFLPFAFQDGGVVPRHGYNGEDGSFVEPSSEDDGFAPAVERTLGFEGGLNPRDTTGMPSMYGISQKAHPGIDVTKITPQQAKDIYRKEYWEGIGASKLPADVREMAYDTSVLAGPGKAKQLLAQTGGDPEKFMAARRDFLNRLVERDPEKYGKYAKAWESRNQALEGGLGAARNELAQSREEIPLTDPRRKFMATDQSREDTTDEGGLGGLAKEEYVVPALAGLGTALAGMVGAKTVSPGAAIASGLGQGIAGGAKTYQEMRKDQLGREIEKAKLGLQERGVGVEELKSNIALKELLRKQEEVKRISELLSGKRPEAVPPTEGTTPTTKSDAMRMAEESSKEAARLRQAASLATDAETQQKFITLAQQAENQANTLRTGSPEFKQQTAISDIMSDEFKNVQKLGKDAPDNIVLLNKMKTYLDDPSVYTGLGAEQFLDIKKGLQGFGVTGLEKGIADTERFGAAAKKMVTDATGGSLGAGISNADVRFLESRSASLGTSKEANKEIIDQAVKIEKRKMEIADFQRRYIKSHGSLDENYNDALASWANAHPLFLQNEERAAPSTLPPKDQLKVGEIYTVGGRKGKWTGTGFVGVE